MAVVSPYAPVLNDGINVLLDNLLPPSGATLDPVTGSEAGGTAVTITGEDLTGVNSVTFDGAEATDVTVVSDTEVTCVTPAGQVGAVNVVVTDPDGAETLTDAFTYTAEPPSIVSIDPVTGPEAGSTSVTVTGTYLDEVTEVTFGGAAGTSLVVVSATELTVTTPAGTGVVDVVVTDPNGTDTLTAAYTYTA